jgi:MFS family permease
MLFSPLAGWLADSFGRQRILLVARGFEVSSTSLERIRISGQTCRTRP